MNAHSRFRVVGLAEGVSFLLLLGVAMPLKYFAGWPMAVRVVGMIHGVLFLLYMWQGFQQFLQHDWPRWRLALLVVAAFLPGGPILFDRWLHRSPDAPGDEGKPLGPDERSEHV
ncbi:DUF3817 domain-containing protein [bacterium AH-315-N03]|nr:DUF3817 domain-containing protein [bacterium AH-315-N03]